MSVDYAKVVKLLKQGQSINSIATTLKCKWDTVSRIKERCTQVWDDISLIPDNISSGTLKEMLSQPREAEIDENTLQPDSEGILIRQRKEHLTRNELWSDYAAEASSKGLNAYSISRFNEIVSGFARKNDVCVQQKKNPGIEAQVDWVGDKAKIIDGDTGEETELHLFVMALPYSSYFYVEAFYDEKMKSWLAGHKHAFEFFGGCPAMMVPDNCKTAVNQSRKWYFDSVVLNPKYEAFMNHYNVVVCPARVYHPKDKSVVERSVQIVEQDLMKAMAKLEIHSLAEYNKILWLKLKTRLAKDFTKRIGSRASIFLSDEKNQLLPLPVHEYQSVTETEAIVGRDFHIQYMKAFYSVPSDYVRDKVIVRDDGFNLQIYNQKRVLIATHRKAIRLWARVTDPNHIPTVYGDRDGYSPEYFRSWGSRFGLNTLSWVDMMLERSETPVHAFRPLYTTLVAANKFDKDVVEEASRIAVNTHVFYSKPFKALLVSKQKEKDKAAVPDSSSDINCIYFLHAKEVENEEN